MADEKPNTVRVTALQDHTYNGTAYRAGETYDIDEQYAESVTVQGKAVRATETAPAPKAKK